ncbi:FUSC family protein [Streptomyces subrutilus]|uniref:FUSC family protein n=1 Tax=Streptomyces subrutilus TaxID=36818 RepID=UPI00340E3B2B
MRRWWKWTTQEARNARGAAVSALRTPGAERLRAVQALKAAGAAVLAWAIAGWWWEAPMAIMAPWSAVLLVRATVYQSVRCSGQQFLAIALGTVTAALAGTLTGNTLTAMIVSLPVTALAGSHRAFGEYGLSASATAVFVLTYGSYSAADIGHRLVESLVGSVIGIAVNAFVLPPRDLRRVEQSLDRMRRHTCDLLSEIAQGLRRDADTRAARRWHEEARRLGSALTALRDAREHTGEVCRMNPAVLVHGGREALPAQWWDEHWERLAEQVRALTVTLVHLTATAETSPPLPRRAVTGLAETLAAAARLCELEPVSGQEQDPYDHRDRDERWRTAWDAHTRLSASATGADPVSAETIAALAAHTRQLLEELHRAQRHPPEPRPPEHHGLRIRRRRPTRRTRRPSRAH